MRFSTKKLCRAGIIAALYAALTLALSPVSFGPLQIRPAEALTILPLFFIESVPALFIGCLLANLISPYGLLDVFAGSATTLLAAAATYIIGRLIKKDSILKIIMGGLPPVLLNAFILPLVWMFAGGMGAFWANFYPIVLTQTLFVYGIGVPLYYSILSLRKKNISTFF